ncbi:f-box only protein [Anaeramoeba ignava]|uniref:F-box only protein n=1 Tax=Anaeramoeba ignava TaxID=1746090 RepID=A0A9Q0RAP2_ANAIG|nr:f-box only protein [Anaeramoeba ignava]
MNYNPTLTPANMVTQILFLGRDFSHKPKQAKFNKNKIQRFSERAKTIINHIRKMNLQSDSNKAENLKEEITHTFNFFKNSSNFLLKHTDTNWIHQFTKHGTAKDHFKKLFEDMKVCGLSLSQEISEMWGSTKEDEIDEEKDSDEFFQILEDLLEDKVHLDKIIEQQTKIKSINKNQIYEALEHQKFLFSLHKEYEPENWERNIHISEIPPSHLKFGNRIGIGGYGEVFLGERNGETVAIKQLIDLQTNSDVVQQFKKEVYILAGCQHRNIIQLLGGRISGPPYYYVMEYHKLGDLSNFIHSIQKPLYILLDIARQVCVGMQFLHDKKVMHRDLKPQNILISEQDGEFVAKIIDFGDCSVDKTLQNTLKGTPGRIAPEVINSEAGYTFSADIFSFGMILWEIYHRQQPFSGLTFNQINALLISQKNIEEKRPKIKEDCPSNLKKLIEECWAEIPTERPSFKKIEHELSEILVEMEKMNDNQNIENDEKPIVKNIQKRIVSVKNVKSLISACRTASPGEVIELSSGTYHVKKPLVLNSSEIIIRPKRLMRNQEVNIQIDNSLKPLIIIKGQKNIIQGIHLCCYFESKNSNEIFKENIGIVEICEGNEHVIQECTIESKDSRMCCVFVHGSATNTTIKENNIFGGKNGILLFDKGYSIIEKNEIFSSFENGIRCDYESSVDIFENRIHNNLKNAVMIKNSRVQLKLNRISSAQFGVFVKKAQYVLIEQNTIFMNSSIGVYIENESKCDILSNEVFQNRIGIDIDETSKVKIEKNTLSKNEDKQINIPLSNQTIIQKENEIEEIEDDTEIDSGEDDVQMIIHEQQKRIVDISGKTGGFKSINEAISISSPGDTIKILAGIYQEKIILDKENLTIKGAKNQNVSLKFKKSSPLLIQAQTGTISNINFIYEGERQYAVEIPKGSVCLTDCTIRGQGVACVGIHDSANPQLKRCKISHGKVGVVFYNSAQGKLIECDISENAIQGVVITTNATPVLSHCNVFKNNQGGIAIYDSGKGEIEHSDISFNKLSGVQIRSIAMPVFHDNNIHHNQQAGIFIFESGGGEVLKNKIFENGKSGVAIKSKSDPKIFENEIYSNKESGVFVYNTGFGSIENNKIYSNSLSGLQIKVESNPRVKGNSIYNNEGSGVFVYHHGLGVIEFNEIHSNNVHGIDIGSESNPEVHSNRIYNNELGGLFVLTNGAGVFTQNLFYSNQDPQIFIQSRSSPTIDDSNIIPENGIIDENKPMSDQSSKKK